MYTPMNKDVRSIAIMNEIQKRSRIPIIYDADIERGFGQRFPSGTDFPPMMAITATGNPENAYEVGKIVATESRAAGIHWNLSPVVDVNNNPLNPIINTRSFSEDEDIVSEFSKVCQRSPESWNDRNRKTFPRAW